MPPNNLRKNTLINPNKNYKTWQKTILPVLYFSLACVAVQTVCLLLSRCYRKSLRGALIDEEVKLLQSKK